MTPTSPELAAPQLALTRDLLIGIGPALAGILIVAALVLAAVYGRRRRAREPAPPRPEEQPRPPEHPIGYEAGTRSPDEVPQDGHRRTPHELKEHGNTGTRPGDPKDRGKWEEGHSGSFGNG